MSHWNDRVAPGLTDFFALADEAFARLPAPIRAAAGDVTLHVEDFASEDLLQSLSLEDPFELSGNSMTESNLMDRSVTHPAPVVSRVTLFRRPILDEWAERADVTLGDFVSHVLIYEIGHHMGFSDADIDALLDEDA